MYPRKGIHLFGSTRAPENRIDVFFDKVTEAGIAFEKASAAHSSLSARW